jgi:hypothetical protein
LLSVHRQIEHVSDLVGAMEALADRDRRAR